MQVNPLHIRHCLKYQEGGLLDHFRPINDIVSDGRLPVRNIFRQDLEIILTFLCYIDKTVDPGLSQEKGLKLTWLFPNT